MNQDDPGCALATGFETLLRKMNAGIWINFSLRTSVPHAIDLSFNEQGECSTNGEVTLAFVVTGIHNRAREVRPPRVSCYAPIGMWDALTPEEKMRAGSRDMHSTPEPRRAQSPGGPFVAWAQCETRGH